jgi:hypothetical protein
VVRQTRVVRDQHNAPELHDRTRTTAHNPQVQNQESAECAHISGEHSVPSLRT